jgi:uncharacterized protein (TIGR02594 family)
MYGKFNLAVNLLPFGERKETGTMSGRSRRDFLASASGLIASGLLSAGLEAKQPNYSGSKDIGRIPELPADLKAFANRDDLNQNLLVRPGTKGILPAHPEETEIGRAIVSQAPFFSPTSPITPLDIARYFLAIAQDTDQKFDALWPSYMRAWPVRANPVIVTFFTDTHTKPAGDTTAWCSAFVNWCIDQARKGRPDKDKLLPPTHNAASKSWRSWGKGIVYEKSSFVTSNGTPSVGDVVVFVDTADTVHGHVCFYLGREGYRIRVLGGNQLEGKPIRHVISEKLIPLWGGTLQIHSIRSDPGLH